MRNGIEDLRAEVAGTVRQLECLDALAGDGTAEVDDSLRDRIQVLRGGEAALERAMVRPAGVGDALVRLGGRRYMIADMVQRDGRNVSGFARRWRASENETENTYVLEIAY